MKVIDFHTHIFPEKIASRAIGKLEKNSGLSAFSDGTLDGLLQSMKRSGVDLSVVLPVVTSLKQFQKVNEYAAKMNKEQKHLISFGGIHPQSQNWQEELSYIKELGLKGVKIHPDYQETYVDTEEMVAIVQYAIDLGLHVVFHSGVDVGFPNPVHCTPKRARALLGKLHRTAETKGQIIFAHTGAHEMWDDVEKYLVGQDVYFDLAFNLGRIPDEQLKRIINKQGADRILFATDSPWDGQKEDIAYLEQMNLPHEIKEAIFYQNGERLLQKEI